MKVVRTDLFGFAIDLSEVEFSELIVISDNYHKTLEELIQYVLETQIKIRFRNLE